jgi:hypothetical protein
VIKNWASRIHGLFLVAFVLALGLTARADQSADAVAQFPERVRVTADYPNDAERYVAFTSLWDALEAKSATAPAAIQKRSAYYDASQAIRQKYQAKGGTTFSNFDTKVRHLTFDGSVRHAVLAKYHLDDEAAAPVTAHAALPDKTFLLSLAAMLPLVAGTFVTMLLLVKRLMRNTAAHPAGSVPPRATGDLAHLPDALRLVEVPGLEYNVELLSGRVLDKGTTPPLWLRTLAGQDISWTLPNAAFRAGPGQIVSGIAQRRKDGTENLLLTYNHATGQMTTQSETAHAAVGARAGWLATLVGTVGFGIALFILFSFRPEDDPLRKAIGPPAHGLEGLILAGLVAAMLVARRETAIFQKRKMVFANNYTPRYTQFLLQLTPRLQKQFETT